MTFVFAVQVASVGARFGGFPLVAPRGLRKGDPPLRARATRSVRRLLARLAASRACGILVESQSEESHAKRHLHRSRSKRVVTRRGSRVVRRTRLDPPEARK